MLDRYYYLAAITRYLEARGEQFPAVRTIIMVEYIAFDTDVSTSVRIKRVFHGIYHKRDETSIGEMKMHQPFKG